jgi:hypothetical protein
MQNVYKISTVFLVLVLLAVAVFSAAAFFNGDTLISEQENRTLAPMPPLTAETWFGGGYGTALDDYISDHVLLREDLIPLTRALERLMRVQSRIRIIDMDNPN